MSVEIIHGDCVEVMRGMEPGSVDLVFADPPFNIGVDYGKGKQADKLSDFQYTQWALGWMDAALCLLKPGGTFWLAINDEWVSRLEIMAVRDFMLTRRNWVIWHESFGNALKTKFSRCKRHLLYFVKDSKQFTFNADSVRIESQRQRNGDKRANPKGCLPSDVWKFSRVCGTFGERVKWHPAQMPEAILERIVLACSNPGDTVLDPFLGSGATGVACHRHGRNIIGIDSNAEYVAKANERILATARRLGGRR